jgi:hypothetical protein
MEQQIEQLKEQLQKQEKLASLGILSPALPMRYRIRSTS